MESLLISLVSVALIVIATVTMMMSSFHSAVTLTDSWKQMEQQAGKIRRTEITAAPPSSYQGGIIELTVNNQGQTNLADFSQWDIIAQKESEAADYIDYNADLPANSWKVKGIYQSDNSTEVFDPNILNPGEKMIVRVNLDPGLGSEQTARITVATPDGVTSECQVIRE